MKVLVVADVLGKENNGTTIAAMNLIRYLESQGDEVRVLCCDKDKRGNESYYIVPHLHLGLVLDYFIRKNGVSIAIPKKKIVLQALEGVDIVHVILPFAVGVMAAKEARKQGIPVTAGFHCQAENFTAHIKLMNFGFINNMTYKSFYKKLYQYVDAVHYPTDFIRNYFEEVIKKKTNAYVISNGVNSSYRKKEVERTGPYKDHFNILTIGRYSKEKSHHLLIKAIARSKYKDNIQLIMAGDGPYKNEYVRLAKKYGLLPPIFKFFSRDELVDVINMSDLYCHSAEVEIEAISCLEAITCGLVPVIHNSNRSATKAFALTENNLFDHNDVEDYARKIDYWIEHPEEREECSKSYLGYTERFEQEECMRQMREMLLTYANNPLSHTSKRKYYYRDEINEDFANNGISQKHNKPGYKYVDRSPIYKFFAFLAYYVFAKPLVWCLNKLVYGQKIVNKDILKKYKDTGYFIYANHTSGMGDAFTPNILTSKRNYIIVNEDATSIVGTRHFVKMVGAIPLPHDPSNIKPFVDAIETRIKKDKASITIYPEAHIWPTYTKIRNFPEGSFHYPVDLNVPCFVIVNTYQKRKHNKKPRLVSYVEGPFYPDPSLSRKDAIKKLRDEIYTHMVEISNKYEQVEQIRYIKLDK